VPRFRIRRPSPALVVACVALLVALGGTGYAAVALPRNSVGTPQLKDGAVTSLKVRNGSLVLADVAAGERAKLRGPAGAPGPAGAKGDRGDAGVKGDRGDRGEPGVSRYTIVSTTRSSTSSSMGIQVNCPAGTRPLGGGGGTSTPAAGVTVRNSFPVGGATPGWLVVADAKTPGAGWSYTVEAVCAAVSP
jgi:hypothetical protein